MIESEKQRGGNPLKDNPSITVIGAGAVGGITAGFLKEAGYDVELVCKYPERAERINGKGLQLKGVRGEKHVKIRTVAEIEQLSGIKDIILIVTKAYDMPDAARRALPFSKADTLFVSMQNGICVDALASIVGAGRTVGCVIGWGATMSDDGSLEMTSEGDLLIGCLQPGLDLSLLKKAFENVVPTTISINIMADLYSKMVINACITSLGALCGLYLGEMLKLKIARDLFIAIIGEAVDVADAMKMTIPSYGGKIDYHKLMEGRGAMADLRRHSMIRIVGLKYKNLKSSSLQSLQRGKPTEVDYFNGYIMRKGEELGIKTPVNRRIVEMIKEIEAGKRAIDTANFKDELLNAALVC
jgi:2-dehydropantoate 2-reductase